MYFSPATGANALESDILAKYESLGGPVGSDLGFPDRQRDPTAVSVLPAGSSRSPAADKPVIFWTPTTARSSCAEP